MGCRVGSNAEYCKNEEINTTLIAVRGKNAT